MSSQRRPGARWRRATPLALSMSHAPVPRLNRCPSLPTIATPGRGWGQQPPVTAKSAGIRPAARAGAGPNNRTTVPFQSVEAGSLKTS